jgi:hypothetical protein
MLEKDNAALMRTAGVSSLSIQRGNALSHEEQNKFHQKPKEHNAERQEGAPKM